MHVLWYGVRGQSWGRETAGPQSLGAKVTKMSITRVY